MRIIITILLGFQFLSLSAQERKIEGRLLMAEDFGVAPGVLIQTIDKKYHAITDSLGKFSMILPLEYDSVVINFIGFEPDIVRIEGTKPIFRLLYFEGGTSHGQPIKNPFRKKRLQKQFQKNREELYQRAISQNAFYK